MAGPTSLITMTSTGSGTLEEQAPGELVLQKITPSLEPRAAARSSTSVASVYIHSGETPTQKQEHPS